MKDDLEIILYLIGRSWAYRGTIRPFIGWSKKFRTVALSVFQFI
jgi:hypothetical protein